MGLAGKRRIVRGGGDIERDGGLFVPSGVATDFHMLWGDRELRE